MSVHQRHLTDHAIARYRLRHDKHATRETIQAIVDAAAFRATSPGAMNVAHNPDGYLVAGDAVFPFESKPNGYVVVTCLRRARKSKADRRALRDIAREEQEWAA